MYKEPNNLLSSTSGSAPPKERAEMLQRQSLKEVEGAGIYVTQLQGDCQP